MMTPRDTFELEQALKETDLIEQEFVKTIQSFMERGGKSEDWKILHLRFARQGCDKHRAWIKRHFGLTPEEETSIINPQ